ncbi:MAG: apolipoprotein N-acyltransferase [Pseudomonadota bacterium]
MRRPWIAPAHAGPRRSGRTMLMAAVAGACAVFAFAPFGYWPIQLLSIAFLFYQVGLDAAVKRSALIGWAFGFGWSVAGMHWLYIAMHRFGGLPSILSVLAVCLLGAYMGLFSAAATAGAAWLRKRWSLPVAAYLMLALPACWGLSEWMRGWLFTGFPWVVSGYAHNASPLKGYAPLLGVYGVGLLAALCAGALAMLTQRARLPALGAACALLAAGYGLSDHAWTRALGAPISVRLLQGNVAQDEKFDAAHFDDTLKLYRAMITAGQADLIATPETAIPRFPHNLPPDYLPGLIDYAHNSGSHLLLGIPLIDSPLHYANSIAGVAPNGRPYRFDKQHLVPFGEFVPIGFHWFVDMMQIPLGEYTRGPLVQAPFAVKDQMVLPNICYEDVFGEEIAMQLRSQPQPATILLNESNLAWYGESIAIPQHLQMSQMRAIETGRPMLRSTNNGATAIIDGQGKVLQQLAPYTRGTLAANVQGMGGSTPYIQFGNTLFLLLAALLLAAAWLRGMIYRKNAAKTP